MGWKMHVLICNEGSDEKSKLNCPKCKGKYFAFRRPDSKWTNLLIKCEECQYQFAATDVKEGLNIPGIREIYLEFYKIFVI